MRIEPVYLPEFGLVFSWAMCRNPRCPNFGVHFEGECPAGGVQVSDGRYTVVTGTDSQGRRFGEIRCRSCRRVSRLASNAEIRPIARYFLSLSLPFADCPDAECENHGANLFEHWVEPGTGQRPRYQRDWAHAARCIPCVEKAALAAQPLPAPIVLGTARRAAYRPQTRVRWRAILDGLRARRPGADRVDLMGMKIASYYGSLARIAARLRDYQAFQNAHLWHPGHSGGREPVALYTNVVEIPVATPDGCGPHAVLRVIVSAIAAGGSAYTLAAHPYFLPNGYHPDAGSSAAGRGRREFVPESGCLPDPFVGDSVHPDGGFIRSPYAELAHFLVVRKMLDRFETIHHCMDAASDLVSAALVAGRDGILAGRPDALSAAVGRRPPITEIALVQRDRSAQEPRILWLTDMPGKTYAEHGDALCSRASLGPVDAIANSIRLPGVPGQRNSMRTVGRGRGNRYLRPDVVFDEVMLHLLARNLTRREPGTVPVPAVAMGLLEPGDIAPNLAAVAWRFRLGIEHAETMSRWYRA